MPRTKPADQRRADLMAAAQALFIERGIAATTLEDVTARAGVSKGLFYQYFHSKDDLLLALQEDFAVRLSDRMRKAIAAEATWPEKLDASIQACYRGFGAEHDLHEVLFRHTGAVGHAGSGEHASSGGHARSADHAGSGGHAGAVGYAGSADHAGAGGRAGFADRVGSGGRADSDGDAPRRESSHHLLVETFRALLTDGAAAGAFHVEDIAATALLLACAMHAFDPTFLALTRDRLSGQRLLHATQVLGRRVAGIAEPPPQPHPRSRAR